MLLILSLLSIIPYIDIKTTRYINSFKIQKYTKFFSDKIIIFNLFVNIFILYNYKIYLEIFIRYFIELFIINFCFKCFLDRPRPKYSLLKNNIICEENYISIFNLQISKNWSKDQLQSFPSGHVSTVYLTYYLINNHYYKIFYFILLLLTIISRINLAAHHLSDCICAILLCNFSLFIFYNILNLIIF